MDEVSEETGLLPGGKAPTVARRAVRLAIAHWRLVFATTAILVVPLELWRAYLQRDLLGVGLLGVQNVDPGAGSGGGLLFLVFLLQFVVVSPVVIAVAFFALTGAETQRDALLPRAFAKWGKVLGATIAQVLAPLLAAVPAFAVLGAAVAISPTASVNPGYLIGGLVLLVAGLVVGGYLALRLFIAVPIAVVEPHGLVAALRQSWRRMPGYRWQAIRGSVGVFFRLGIAVLAVMLLLEAVAQGLGPAAWSLSGFASGVGTLLLAVISSAVAAVLYLDTLPQAAHDDASDAQSAEP